MSSKQHITFIGGGNMAQSLIAGICANGYPSKLIGVSDPNTEKLTKLAEKYGINTYNDNTQATKAADIIVLAVKPNTIKPICQEIAPQVKQTNPLIISIATGITFAQFSEWLGEQAAVVRVMPNTPSQILQGVSGLTANKNVSTTQRTQAENLFKTVGLTDWFSDENLLHAVTALSGSGPAYYFLFMEAMAEVGVNLGLAPETAKNFSIQTALGAAKLAAASPLSLEELRAQVTSPNGTTSRAIQTFEAENIRGLMHKAMSAAYKRSIEISNEGNK